MIKCTSPALFLQLFKKIPIWLRGLFFKPTDLFSALSGPQEGPAAIPGSQLGVLR